MTKCPECDQGKHANCTGWALDEHDNEVACGCECRRETPEPSDERYVLTFGERYSYYEHPDCPVAHPDAHVVVVAPSYMLARQVGLTLFGTRWSGLYEERTAEAERWYPHRLFTVQWSDPEFATALEIHRKLNRTPGGRP